MPVLRSNRQTAEHQLTSAMETKVRFVKIPQGIGLARSQLMARMPPTGCPQIQYSQPFEPSQHFPE